MKKSGEKKEAGERERQKKIGAKKIIFRRKKKRKNK
jgi:hypothetical protein